MGAGSKFGANIVLGEGTKVGEGSSFLGAKEEGKEGGAAMSAVPQGEVEEYYRPDPGETARGPTQMLMFVASLTCECDAARVGVCKKRTDQGGYQVRAGLFSLESVCMLVGACWVLTSLAGVY